MVTEKTWLRERFDDTIRLRKSTGEAAILLILGALGLFAVVYSQTELPLENPFGAGVGPRLFPQLAGAVMVLMSVYLLALRLWRRRRNELDDEVIDMEVQDGLRVLAFIVLCVGYMLAFEDYGFLATTSSLLFLLFITNGFQRYILAAFLAVGLTVAMYIAFTIALGLPLPAPVLRDAFGVIL